MKVFIYVLTEPDQTTIRYVGKSNEYRVEKRLIEHCRISGLKNHTHKNMWIKSLLQKNQKPGFHIIEECTEETYRSREKYWVDHYKKLGCNLTNGTAGGEGAIRIHNRSISEEQRRNISETLKQRYRENPLMKENCSNAGKKTKGIKRNFKFKQASSHVGVSHYKNKQGIPIKWRAYTWENKKQKHLGVFSTEQEAIEFVKEYSTRK